MVIDGAFHVPSWLRQLAIHPMDLIAHCRREEGGEFGMPTQGAVILAQWLLDDAERAERAARQAGSPLSMGGVITRVLAGSIVPSQALVESLGGMTGGAVTFDLFEREAQDMPESSELAALPVAGPDPESQSVAQPVLGAIAPGPLWTARTKGKRIIVSGGFGIDMAMDAPAGATLYATLGRALAKLGDVVLVQAR